MRVDDHQHGYLKWMAEQHGTIVQHLMDDLATQALVEFDAETRFNSQALHGSGQLNCGLELLKKTTDGA